MALTANELRIGNFVNVDNIACYVEDFIKDFERTYIVRVVYTKKEEGSVSFIRPIKDIKPIPLSPEVLKDCGFDMRSIRPASTHTGFAVLEIDGYIGIKYKLSVYPNDKRMFLGGQLQFPIEYLHQLQNIIHSLSGKELTYNHYK